MESIKSFFSRAFGGFIDRLSDQMRYKITDIAESKIREDTERLFNQTATVSKKNIKIKNLNSD